MDRSEDVLIMEYIISCSCDFWGCCLTMHIHLSLFCALNNRKTILFLIDWLHKDPSIFNLGISLFLNWESLVLDWDSWFFTRWAPGLTITICNKITDTDDGCYPDLDLSGSDCLFHENKLCQPIRSTSQIMVVTCHEYGVPVLVPQTSLRQEASGGVAKCQLFSKVTFKLFQFVC